MALGASSSSVSPSASATTSSSSGSSSGSRGANYFFGFLVTFIALLFIFVGCGVGTRRRLQRRRALLTELGGWNNRSFATEHEQLEPPLVEPRFVRGGEKWLSMQPLSTAMVRRGSASPCPSPPLVQTPSRNQQALHGLSLPTWSLQPVPVEEKFSCQETLQVAVMIAMPSCSREGADPVERPPDYQIGVACVPWVDKIPT